jgi:hypothetical protein
LVEGLCVAEKRMVLHLRPYLIGVAGAMITLVSGCGGSSGTSRSSSSSASSVVTATTGARASITGGAAATTGQGVIGGVAFTAGSAFAQYDRMQKGWWIVIGGPGHACTDTTASVSQIATAVVPNVNGFFPAATPRTLPPTTPQSTGVTFTDKTGYPTTMNGGGATITISHAEPTTGGHWSGSIEVPPQNPNGKRYGFKGTFTAAVCPPAND